MGFDRKEDFISIFKEEQRSDNGPNDWQKQDGRPHDRVARPETAHGRASARASTTLHNLAMPRAI